MRWSDEATNAPDPEAALVGSLQHLVDLRRREDERKLISQLQRNAHDVTNVVGNDAADIDVLRKLQEKARQPDLKRLGT